MPSSFLFKALGWASFRDKLLFVMDFFGDIWASFRITFANSRYGLFSRLMLQILKLTNIKQ